MGARRNFRKRGGGGAGQVQTRAPIKTNKASPHKEKNVTKTPPHGEKDIIKPKNSKRLPYRIFFPEGGGGGGVGECLFMPVHDHTTLL